MSDHKPTGAPDVSPYLIVADAKVTIAFARDVLDAQINERLMIPSDGRVWHAQIHIGDSTIMVGDSRDAQWTHPGFLHIYVADADATYAKAIDAGAEPFMPPEVQFYGHRAGGVTDTNGTIWWFATKIEDVSSEERQRRALEQDRNG